MDQFFSQIYRYEKHFIPAGRVLMGAFFLIMGIQKLIALESVTGYIDAVGLPAASTLALLTGLFEVLAGSALMSGYHAKKAATLLAGFVILATAIFHNHTTWANDPTGQIMFLKNLAILGGLLFMIVHSKDQ